MWRELILDTRIAETNDQFHATIPSREGITHRLPATELLLLLFLGLLLGLFRLLGNRGFALFLGLRLALLDDFGLGGDSSSFRRHRFRRGDNFFLHGGYVSHGLVRV